MTPNNPARPLLVFILSLAFSIASHAQATPSQSSNASQPDAHTVPVIDGGAGPCSADFTVNDANGSPVYNATIKVHIAYGFMYARKLDLQAGTNIDGKARFTGIPDRTKRGLLFEASQGDRAGEAFDDTAQTCTKQFTITLQKKP